jgi:hypothetical protein
MAGISIDFSQLDTSADLQNLLSSRHNAILSLGSSLDQDRDKSVSSLVGASYGPFTFTDTLPSWTAGPVTFQLTPTATCTIKISDKSEDFKVATKVDDTSTTVDVQSGSGTMTYINIDFNFSLTGSASGSGTAYGITITGKACGSAATTLTFCQPVPSGTLTLDALKLAFSQLVFPTGTDCLKRMAPGTTCRMNFDGSLNLGVTASYGLGPYVLSAASASNVVASIQKVTSAAITLPSATVTPLGTASVTYARTDHYGLVVNKSTDGNTALLCIIRSAKNEFGQTAGFSVGVATTNVSVALDPTQFVQDLTGNATVAGAVGSAAGTDVNNLTTSALSKLNTWTADANGTVAASIALDEQDSRTALFNYSVDLTRPEAAESWDSLLTNNIADAMKIPGFTLQAGSGFAEKIGRSTTIQFNICNLFKYSGKQDFFNNFSSELAADGTIRLVFDAGIESVVSVNSATDTMRFHFSATATEGVAGGLSQAEIDLNIEISEKNDPAGAAGLAKVLGIVGQASLQPTIDAMNAYAAAHQNGTLGLVAVVKQAAYSALPHSPYTPDIDGKPPVDQNLDRANWDLVHNNVIELGMGSAKFVGPLSYDDWAAVNIKTNGLNPGETAARRLFGAPITPIPRNANVWHGFTPELVYGFLTASSCGMNLFEDLVRLGSLAEAAATEDQWKAIQNDAISIVKNDAQTSFSKPISAAILKQAAAQSGVTVTASTAQAKDATTFTATLTLARPAAAAAGAASNPAS